MPLGYAQTTQLIARNTLLFLVLCAVVYAINLPVLHYDMMYIEQPTVYLANQTIHSWHDLLAVYLHPKLFDLAVPFFRPSGHFLLYHLLAPLIGWHNTRGWLLVNFLFLALTSYVIVKLYQALFPRFAIGGYVAALIYAMQPALMLSRLTIMHFEYAYVFFAAMSMYFFVLFCQRNRPFMGANTTVLQAMPWLALSLTSFLVGCTFKEPAIMVGPVLMSYLLLTLYADNHMKQCYRQREIRQLLLLLICTSSFIMLYLTSAWQAFSHPDRAATHAREILASAKELFCLLLNLPRHLDTNSGLYATTMVFRKIITPPLTYTLLWIMEGCGIVTLILLLTSADNIQEYKKSFLFLAIAMLLFLALPTLWAIGMPWHLSLSLFCFSLMLGFSVDYLLTRFCSHSVTACFSLGLCCLLIFAAYQVNSANVIFLSQSPEQFIFQLNRNAVLHPPTLQKPLQLNSILLVEDQQNLGDYALGNATYPFFLIPNFNYTDFAARQKHHYVQYQPEFNGTLFRWAYLMPTLHEELYPFHVEKMDQVLSLTVYKWLRHADAMSCVGYDNVGEWHDKTRLFRKNLQAAKQQRHLIVAPYRTLAQTALSGQALSIQRLSLPDSEQCEFTCDQDSRCKGFTYVQANSADRSASKCHFYRTKPVVLKQSCAICTGFVKMT